MTVVLTFKSVDEILHVLYVITIQMKPLQQYMYFHIVWFQKISIPPSRKGFAVWPPLPSGISKIGPPNLPPSLPDFQNFCTPPGIIANSHWSEQISSFFTRVPHFVSFMYFLLNSITDKRIPHVLKLQCILNKFLATRK